MTELCVHVLCASASGSTVTTAGCPANATPQEPERVREAILLAVKLYRQRTLPAASGSAAR